MCGGGAAMAANRSRMFADVFIHHLHRYVYCQNYYDQVRPDNDIFIYVRYLRLVMSDCIDNFTKGVKKNGYKKRGGGKEKSVYVRPSFLILCKGVSVFTTRVLRRFYVHLCKYNSVYL